MRRAVADIAAALARFPGSTVDLLVGEPCFAPPPEVTAAFERSAATQAASYGPPAGMPGLRKMLAEWTGGRGARASNVVVTHGAKGGLLTVFATLLDPGDRVIHPLPCYPAYPAMIRRFGGVPVGVAETAAGFSGWGAALVDAVDVEVAAVVLSSPANPSGSVISEDDLFTVCGVCRDRGIRLILDEAYRDFRFVDEPDPLPELPVDNTVVRVGSASKGLALPGWRIGWIIADVALAARLAEVQGALLNPPAIPPQQALHAVPDVTAAYFRDNRRRVHRRLEAVTAALTAAGFDATMPEGGFYLWVDVRARLDGASTIEWCTRLAEERGVGLWPGEDYGVPGFVRLALPRGDGWREDVEQLGRRLSSGG